MRTPQAHTDHDLTALRETAATIAREAGTLIHDLRNTGVRVDNTKSSTVDIVTTADHAAEALIVERLIAARPDDGIVAEEGHSRESRSGITWVIDPIDGTVNYFYDLPAFCVSIAATVESADAYADGRLAVAAAVYNPRTDELFTAALGEGATRNSEPVTVAVAPPLAESLVATGFGYTRERRLAQHAMLGRVIGEVRDIRRYGSAAYDLCMVASGRINAYFEWGIQPWDWAAGALIATEAGAITRGFTEHSPAGQEMFIAGPAELVEEIQLLLAKR